MLAVRVIPTILCKGTKQVKGTKFNNDRVVGHAMQSCRIHASRGVDELVLLDVSATEEEREPNYENIQRLTDCCFLPISVGGGIKTVEHIRKLLYSGADKVVIGEQLHKDASFMRDASTKFGSQCLVASVDVDDDDVAYAMWRADLYAEMGAGEILLQSMPRDGTMQGYNLHLIKRVSESVNIPVIASGGCSSYEDMYQAIMAGASAVAAGALFQFTEATPREATKYLKDKGVEVRYETRNNL